MLRSCLSFAHNLRLKAKQPSCPFKICVSRYLWNTHHSSWERGWGQKWKIIQKFGRFNSIKVPTVCCRLHLLRKFHCKLQVQDFFSYGKSFFGPLKSGPGLIIFSLKRVRLLRTVYTFQTRRHYNTVLITKIINILEGNLHELEERIRCGLPRTRKLLKRFLGDVCQSCSLFIGKDLKLRKCGLKQKTASSIKSHEKY